MYYSYNFPSPFPLPSSPSSSIPISLYSGPSSINPLTGKEYGTTFPLVTVEDFIKAQFLLLDHMGVDRVHACIGASLGGMQASLAAALYPERVDR